MRRYTFILLAGAIVALAAGSIAQAQFRYYAALTGAEVITDAANPTGSQFTTATLKTYVNNLSGTINAQTGTTYTVLSTDNGKLVTLSNASPVAITLPQATTTGFGSGARFQFENKGAGLVTITPTTSTINGAATLTLKQNRGVTVVSDGVNYQILTGTAGLVTTPLTVAEGGTGLATITAHGVVVGEGTSAVTPLTVGTTGQLLQGATGADPAFGTTLSGNYVLTGSPITFGSTTPAHVATAQTTPPALTSCGSGSPAIVGTDTAGEVTMGTSATGCVITFNVAYSTAPFCTVTWTATPLASQSYAVSTTAITLTQTSASGNKAVYHCIARSGG